MSAPKRVSGRAGGRLPRASTSAAAALALLTTAACSTSSRGLSGSTPTPRETPSRPASSAPRATSTAGLDAPLLGGPGATRTTASRPLLAIALIAPKGSPPPRGLQEADVVFDELGTDGAARLLALYHSRDATTVGPVDDTRPDDSRILAVTGGMLGHGGGTRGIVVQLDRSVVLDLGRPAHRSAYTTNSAFPAPFDVFTSTAALYAVATGARKPPPPLFSYGGPGRPPPQGAPRTALTVTMPGRTPQTWQYSAGSRSWRMTAGPAPGLTVSNLVVQSVTYKPARVDKRHTINVATVVGEGRVTIAAGRLLGTGTWRKPAPKKLTTYVDDANLPFRLEPGRTWVVLAPAGTSVSAR